MWIHFFIILKTIERVKMRDKKNTNMSFPRRVGTPRCAPMTATCLIDEYIVYLISDMRSKLSVLTSRKISMAWLWRTGNATFTFQKHADMMLWSHSLDWLTLRKTTETVAEVEVTMNIRYYTIYRSDHTNILLNFWFLSPVYWLTIQVRNKLKHERSKLRLVQ